MSSSGASGTTPVPFGRDSPRARSPLPDLVISPSLENAFTQIRPGDGCCRVPGRAQSAGPGE